LQVFPVTGLLATGASACYAALHYTGLAMASDHEVEIKFQIDDIDGLTRRLTEAGFRQITPRTHELNTLYDRQAQLRRRGALLRLRQYGQQWTLTYKDKSKATPGRHKSRREIETRLENGEAAARIFEALGFSPSFSYEKYRSEWTDGNGHVVLDETPIGNYGEIEGPPDWIDATAEQLEIAHDHYITLSYAELFLAWKRRSRSKAKHMLFAEI
jgi:adenylate cyclase, class 2